MKIQQYLVHACSCGCRQARFDTETGELHCVQCGITLDASTLKVQNKRRQLAKKWGYLIPRKKTCDVCGASFTTKRRKKRFCSATCRKQYWKQYRHDPVYEEYLKKRERKTVEKTTHGRK